MKKIIISSVICIILCLSLLLNVFAVNVTNNEQFENECSDNIKNEVIVDRTEIEKIIADEGIDIPDGYYLEKIQRSVYIDSVKEEKSDDLIIEPRAILYSIKNVNVGKEFYYVNDYQSDLYQGPATVSTTYTASKEVKKSLGVNIGKSTVNAAVGYDISSIYTVEKSFSTTVAAGKFLNIKVYPLYVRTTFDIYNKWTDNLKVKGAYTDKPVGLYIEQQTYVKK